MRAQTGLKPDPIVQFPVHLTFRDDPIKILISFGRVATPITWGYIDNLRKNAVFSSVEPIGLFPVETKGLGCRDTSVKYGMPFGSMGCEHCTKPNLFDCHAIHGHLTPECLRRHQEMLEGLR